MRLLTVTLLVSVLITYSSASFASEDHEFVRVHDMTLTDPFKVGLLQGLTLGFWQPSRQTVSMLTPTDAQLPIALEGYVRQHNRGAQVIGWSAGIAYTLSILFCLSVGVERRIRFTRNTRQNTPTRVESCPSSAR